MSKRSEPNSKDIWSQGDRNYGKPNQPADSKGDIQNNTLEYFIQREKTIQILKKKGIKNLYPIQQQTFRHIYKGQDILARDRTGSGKTMAFVLPVIQRFRNSKFEHRNPKFLIILPTRELAIQVNNEIDSLKYRDEDDFVSLVVYGKSSLEDNMRRLREGIDILVATPGRLNDLIEKGSVKLDSTEVICLDEADEILKQGFKEEIQKVFQNMKRVNKNKVQVLLFSATIPSWLKGLSQEYQTRDRPYINLISDDQTRSSKTIKHLCCEVSRFSQSDIVQLIEQMIQKYGGVQKRILIFCDRKIQVDTLSMSLNIPNQPLHGDVNQRRRENAYRDFKSGLLRCIVATNVAARGLDFPHVDLVIQMTPPINTEEYIHRSGRTGRAGKEGTCLTFFDRTKSRIIQKIEDEAKITIQKLNIDLNSLSSSRSGYERNDRGGDRYDRGGERNDRGGDRYDRGGERNDRGGDRYERGGRQERGGSGYDKNDGFERKDRKQRGGYERRDGLKQERRNDYEQRNEYGDWKRQEKENKGSLGRLSYDRNEGRDPRPRPYGREERRCNTVDEKRKRSHSKSPYKERRSPNKERRSPNKERKSPPYKQRKSPNKESKSGYKESEEKKRSTSNSSRSVSKERRTTSGMKVPHSERRGRSPSPRKERVQQRSGRKGDEEEYDY